MKSKADKIMRGSKLQNGTGAIVLEKKAVEDAFIILCIIPKNHEYVTWWMNQQGQTYYGHYTLDLKGAIKELEFRS